MASKNTEISDKMSKVVPRAARGLGHTSALTFEGRFSLSFTGGKAGRPNFVYNLAAEQKPLGFKIQTARCLLRGC